MSKTNTKRANSSKAGTAEKRERMTTEDALKILREKGLLVENESEDSGIISIIGYPSPSATKQ